MHKKNVRYTIFYFTIIVIITIILINFQIAYKGFFKTWRFDKRGDFSDLCRSSTSPYADGTMLCYYTRKVYKGYIDKLFLPEKNMLNESIGRYHPGISELFLHPARMFYTKYNYHLSEREFEYFKTHSSNFLHGKNNKYWFVDIYLNATAKQYAIFKYHDNIMVLPYNFR